MSHALMVFLGSYLLGCLATGYYLVHLRLGQDLRDLGSGSTGAKNVARVLGPGASLLTLAGDIGKGALAVWLVRYLTSDDRLAALAMLGVAMGHVWPFQLGFRGGKGMATSLGALLVFDFRLTLLSIGVLLTLCCLLRRTVLSGLIAFALIPLLAKMLMDRQAWEVIALSLLAGMVLVAHRKNLIDEAAQLPGRRSEEPDPDELVK
jgi:glycerol-3-phosphate acyltransferase PlsY